MDWLLANPQIHSLFSSLGVTTGDTYAVSPEALPILEEINFKLTFEDQALRTFRRAIGLGQNVKSDIIPLLINAKDLNILDAGIRILVNLTMPVECLFSVDVMYRTEVGRHTIFELNKLLITTKEALTEPKTTKSIVDYMKSVLESDTKLSISQCDSINNCLLLFRNILHIPENNIITQGILCGNATTMQNTILWNLFTQSIDKLLIYMMSCSQRSYWAVTMVQLIAIMYKDQQVNTLQKLLNVWFEASLSDSSDDNESNTSPKQGSSDSSPMLTSDPTSDSSDNGNGKQQSSDDRRLAILNKETEATLQEVSRKGQEYQNTILQVSPVQQQAEFDSNEIEDQEMGPPNFLPQNSNSNASSPETGEFPRKRKDSGVSLSSQSQKTSGNSYVNKTERSYSQSEISDCGYGTQIENQESISTSSNEEYDPQQKPVHHKRPSNQKQRYNSCKKARTVATAQENKDSRRKKLVKRSKSNLINMKGLVQHIPTDEDITIILKEFVVDFLLKGYGYLVQDLRTELLSDSKFQIDTSHFFWLVTYFLRFASQLELDMEHIRLVLSFNIVSYLTFEGVNICEQFELTSRQNGGDLKPYLRRIHLVVTAIREILQTLGTYKKITHLSQDDVQHLHKLEIQIGNAEDLRNLFVLLLRNYNPTLQSKQYLQDLVVTNNILLVMLEGCDQYLETNGNNVRMTQHISQFATVEIMNHYGILLEGFRDNGEFVNNCIFTMMHHIAGDLGELTMLYQPIILKTFSQIWENDYEISDDWSDLIQLVIHKFMNTPQKTSLSIPSASLTEMTKKYNMEHTDCTWSKEEIDTLYWYYVQSKKCNDVVGKIVKFFCDNGNKQKSRISIIQQLLQQDIIDLVEYDDLMKFEDAKYQRNMTKTPTSSTNISESGNEIKDNFECKPSDDIQVLKSCIIKENKGMLLEWMQKTLLDCCYVKLAFDSGLKENCENIILESIPYHYILKQKSIPLVAWNTEQFAILSYQPFILLLHKLGFHLPADAGKLFVRMPAFWTADIMYKTAQKLGPINKALIKFDLSILISNEENCATQSIKDESTIFAIPAPKSANPIKRFTPDVESTPSVPNWLQVVMRSKCISGDRLDNQVSGTATTTNLTAGQPATSLFNQPPSTSKLHQNCTLDNEDSIMLPLDRIDEGDLQEKRQCQYENMVAEVCENEEMSDFETASVASDLTRMYVSDEEDKADVGPHLL